MKKLIGILGIAIIAMAMFFNTNVVNSSNGQLDLASILNVNTANAECSDSAFDSWCYYGNGCILICNGVTTLGAGYSNN